MDRPAHASNHLLQEACARIAEMEATLALLERSVVGQRSLRPVTVRLRARLTLYYLAREIVRRGRFQRLRRLDDVLLHIELAAERQRFRGLPPITMEEIHGVDLDALAWQL